MLLTAGLSVAAAGVGATLADEGPAPAPAAEVAATTPTSTTTSTTAPPAPPEAFFARLTAALVADDGATLFSLLHPAVLDRYGEEQCRGYLGTVAASDVELELVEVLGEGPVTYASDGLELTVSDGVRIRIRIRQAGASTEQDATLARAEDGSLRWFTDCGTPVPG